MNRKLTLLSLVALVVGSQIGSGAFLLPSSLAAIGSISLVGWCISGLGAVATALVFGWLSMRFPAAGGGPHVYVEQAFGRRAAFFTAWTYWLISWVSSIAVIVAAVSYLSPIIGTLSPSAALSLEIAFLAIVTLLNCRGAVLAGSTETFLTCLKILPLLAVPLAAWWFFEPANLPSLDAQGAGTLRSLNAACLMTFWGFIGLEMATATSALIDNPGRTVPRAVIAGTSLVAILYFFNSVGMMGMIPADVLAKSQAPYALAMSAMLGQGWDLILAAMASIACLGTLNAWVLTSGQIATEAAKANLFPPIFAKTNRFGAPGAALAIVFACTVPLLLFTLSSDLLTQLNFVIDLSVTTFILVYLACVLAFFKIARRERLKPLYFLPAAVSLAFCLWMLVFTPIQNLALCSLFVLSGIPVYAYQKTRLRTFS